MHSIHGYILGITVVCNMLVMYHVEFTATRRFYTNTISYTHADNLTLIYACRQFTTYAKSYNASTRILLYLYYYQTLYFAKS